MNVIGFCAGHASSILQLFLIKGSAGEGCCIAVHGNFLVCEGQLADRHGNTGGFSGKGPCRNLLSQFIRAKVNAGKEVMLQGPAALKILLDNMVALLIIVAISLEDIGQSFIEGDNAVMTDPFVGIVDNFLGKKDSPSIPLYRKIFQHHVFADDLANGWIAELNADIASPSGMVAFIAQADCLGNVMEQGPGQDKIPVRQFCFLYLCCGQAGQQRFRHSGHGQGVGPDIVEHAISIHQGQTLG